jgi:hypothetical protein
MGERQKGEVAKAYSGRVAEAPRRPHELGDLLHPAHQGVDLRVDAVDVGQLVDDSAKGRLDGGLEVQFVDPPVATPSCLPWTTSSPSRKPECKVTWPAP